MIKYIDNVRYLPEDNTLIICSNRLLNDVAKDSIQHYKAKLEQIDIGEQEVIIEIEGGFIEEKLRVEFNLIGKNEKLVEQINQVLNE